MPPAKLGLVYSHTGLRRFIDAIGAPRTRELFLVGRRIPPPTALDWGLVNDVVGPEGLAAAALDWAVELAGNAPLSVRGNKRVLRALLDRRGRARRRTTERELIALREACFASRGHAGGRARVRREARPALAGPVVLRLHLERQLAARPAPARARTAREARAGRRPAPGDEGRARPVPGRRAARRRVRVRPPQRRAVGGRRDPREGRAGPARRARRAARRGPRRGGALGRGGRRRAWECAWRASTSSTAARSAARRSTRSSRSSTRWRAAPASSPAGPLIVGGDFNVAPTDEDVYDPAAFAGATHVTRGRALAPGRDPRRRAGSSTPTPPHPRARIASRGGTTAPGTSTRTSGCGSTCCSCPRRSPDGFGGCGIDRDLRKGQKPSDHAPLLCELDAA